MEVVACREGILINSWELGIGAELGLELLAYIALDELPFSRQVRRGQFRLQGRTRPVGVSGREGLLQGGQAGLRQQRCHLRQRVHAQAGGERDYYAL